jgi:endoglucanase
MSRNKLSIAGLIVVFFLSAACTRTSEDHFVAEHGPLSVKGINLVDQHGEILTLRGISLGWHNWWPRFYDRETVAWLKNDWRCNVLRAAIGVEPDNGYIAAPDFALKCLTTVIDAAIENDMYVIVDWHSHNIRIEEAKAFFTLIATKYNDYPNIIYEIFNEPDYETWDEIKDYSEEMIRHIRAIDQENIILVGSPHWDQDVHIASGSPITGHNIMYSLHFYAALHKQELRNNADIAIKNGLPIFVSECAGAEPTGDGPIDLKEWEAWKQWMKERNISWTVWAVTDKEESSAMIKSTDSPLSGWKDSDLKEWGLIVKKALKQ